MAILHKEYKKFYDDIKLTDNRKTELLGSRNSLRKKIKTWFRTHKPNELQPKFRGQGSFDMNTTVNPIVEKKGGREFREYDLDDGIYFEEKQGQTNDVSLNTWHNWIYEAIRYHTGIDPIRKQTCVRVIFAKGHHIDLPIYYKNGNTPKLVHLAKGTIKSDPIAFTTWFHANSNKQIKRLICYTKAWKDFKHNKEKHLKLPSGFALTILIVKFYVEDTNDDVAFRETIKRIYQSLSSSKKFKCLRPTTPKDENIFEEYSDARKNDFITALKSLVTDCDRAKNELNAKTASEYLINRQFGDRFSKKA